MFKERLTEEASRIDTETQERSFSLQPFLLHIEEKHRGPMVTSKAELQLHKISDFESKVKELNSLAAEASNQLKELQKEIGYSEREFQEVLSLPPV